MSSPKDAQPRRPGRPRASARRGSGEPREEIISAAARLFGEVGVATATMSEIARRAGLRQSSVYYYFADKEAILAEILAGVNRAPLEKIEEISRAGGGPALRLFRMIREDVLILCDFPFDLNQVHRLAALREPRFAEYWDERGELHRRFVDVIAEGVATGDFADVDVDLAAHTLLANDEASQNWMRDRATGEDGEAKPAQVADFLARFALRALLADPSRVDELGTPNSSA